MGSEYINSDTVRYIMDILYKKDNNYHYETDRNIVILNSYFNEGYHYQFSKYIPKKLAFLKDVFSIIFNTLPKKLDEFLYELGTEITETKSRYDYQVEFEFDLYNGDLSTVFNEYVIKFGKKYYRDNSVLFLEKIDDKYYAIVKSTEKYLVVIKYNENAKRMLVYCTCPCEFYCKHTYAVIRAIRDNKIRKFYKILYVDKNNNLVENVINSRHILCSGIDGEYFEIINKYG